MYSILGTHQRHKQHHGVISIFDEEIYSPFLSWHKAKKKPPKNSGWKKKKN